MLGLIEKPIDWLEGFGANGGIIIFVLGSSLAAVVLIFIGLPESRVIGFMLLSIPVWLPMIMFLLFFETWLEYVRLKFDINQGRVTLELRLPQEVFKSPEAMELIFGQLYQTAAPDNHVQTYIDGKYPPTFSLEIVSRGGDIKFYMNVPRKKFKNMTEAQLYAQYPGIEVKELPFDYTAEFPWDPSKWFVFSFHYGLKKPDPYPIKTYIDFGLNVTNTEEEQKIDPITVMLEILGSMQQGENMWIQILIRAHKKLNFKTGSLHEVPDWTKEVRAEINSIIEKAKVRNVDGGVQQLTEGEKETVRAMERSVSKYAFHTKFRGMYVADVKAMQPGERLGALAGIWRQYDDINKNQIGPVWRTDTDWPWWQDRGKKHTTAWKRSELTQYKLRVMSQRPHEGHNYSSILTVEELATIFHIPGKVAFTPTLGRIPSTRSEAPQNLPT